MEIKKLVIYLMTTKNNNSCDALYVNPDDFDVFEIESYEKYKLKNDKSYIFVGTMDDLSLWGKYEIEELLESIFEGGFEFRQATSQGVKKRYLGLERINLEAIIDYYYENNLGEEFYNQLTEKMEDIEDDWKRYEAYEILECLPKLVKQNQEKIQEWNVG